MIYASIKSLAIAPELRIIADIFQGKRKVSLRFSFRLFSINGRDFLTVIDGVSYDFASTSCYV